MNLSGCMHTVRNITRQCILWKTHLPGAAEIFTPMCSTLRVRPFLRILSNQHDTVWKQKPLSQFAYKITSGNRRLGLLESSQHFRVGNGLAKLINSSGPHRAQRKMTFLFKYLRSRFFLSLSNVRTWTHLFFMSLLAFTVMLLYSSLTTDITSIVPTLWVFQAITRKSARPSVQCY